MATTKESLEQQRDQLTQYIQQRRAQMEAAKEQLFRVLGKLELLDEIAGENDGVSSNKGEAKT